MPVPNNLRDNPTQPDNAQPNPYALAMLSQPCMNLWTVYDPRIAEEE